MSSHFKTVGPRELTGARDLISHFKLLPHHDFFCKNPRPVSVLDTHYLSNVVGDTEIRKGEGIQLDQLVQTTFSRHSSACIKPFNLDLLGEAFHLQESAPVNLSPVRNSSSSSLILHLFLNFPLQSFAEKGIPTIAVKSKTESKVKDKHRKHKDKHKEKDKDRKKHKRSKEEKEKKREKREKRKKRDGDDDTSGVKKHKKSKHKSSKIDEVGAKWFPA
ncbi:hypothetical protein SASPL_150107 [Salvia splendens]|uniref:Mediator of RNA polymerase II transcription subunit 19 n=1 Tax=Salvia splendens TaxID=180675 RepID=A0A8X8W5Z5_SALSN|nr:hypothetical protein SASPL_150107 [Salvia splendens]